MTDDTLRALVDRRWAELGTEQATGEHRLRVAELGVDTAAGPLLAAVDFEGNRHVMVPIASNQKVRGGLAGPVLSLRKRPLEGPDSYQSYADLGCLRRDMDDLFTLLCTNVLEATKEMPDTPLKALYRVINRWKALFRPQQALLGPDQLAGLFGELLVLNRLLEQETSAHRFWRGPQGYRHDFASVNVAIEVKAGLHGEARRPRIHGLGQLEPPPDGDLWLAWHRIERVADGGVGVADLVDRALHLCDDEIAVLDLLVRAGYHHGDADYYRDLRFLATEERWYRVDDTFPKLTGLQLSEAGIEVSVLDVDYTVDLSGDSPAPVSEDQVDAAMRTMLMEPV
ncbi:hypothetical protein GCM10009839_26580 [Catenulispora yoronensis]|uniref:PD-(D/E)XK motif protein n=1 Tax=Catenulispora yoronensis TaxID=450799 RepID=A0ABN2U319_9ACTN